MQPPARTVSVEDFVASPAVMTNIRWLHITAHTLPDIQLDKLMAKPNVFHHWEDLQRHESRLPLLVKYPEFPRHLYGIELYRTIRFLKTC